ncbi:unnamed protein product [Moneuplotes crassus]|uniref:Uncharacterized protein n=1 Tax=Euplotes crassus TaxID=5936 RepID=A0AAD1UL12_EUPCR|nr:unnamed protein product [Moneuplotes crassus]
MEMNKSTNLFKIKSNKAKRFAQLNADLSFMVKSSSKVKTRNLKASFPEKRQKTQGKNKIQSITEIITPSDSVNYISYDGNHNINKVNFPPYKNRNISNSSSKETVRSSLITKPYQTGCISESKKRNLIGYIHKIRSNKKLNKHSSNLKNILSAKKSFSQQMKMYQNRESKSKTKDLSQSISVSRMNSKKVVPENCYKRRQRREKIELRDAFTQSDETLIQKIFDEKAIFNKLDINLPTKEEPSQIKVKFELFESIEKKNINRSLENGRRIGRMRRAKPSHKAQNLINFISDVNKSQEQKTKNSINGFDCTFRVNKLPINKKFNLNLKQAIYNRSNDKSIKSPPSVFKNTRNISKWL